VTDPEEKKEETAPLVLPVTHKKCPVCGSTRRLGQMKVDEMIKNGELSKDFPYKGIAMQVQILDLAKLNAFMPTNFKVKTIVFCIDACAEPDCGAVYCVTFDIIEQPAQMQMQRQPTPPFPPRNSRFS
jgi:hypothetical protein